MLAICELYSSRKSIYVSLIILSGGKTTVPDREIVEMGD